MAIFLPALFLTLMIRATRGDQDVRTESLIMTIPEEGIEKAPTFAGLRVNFTLATFDLIDNEPLNKVRAHFSSSEVVQGFSLPLHFASLDWCGFAVPSSHRSDGVNADLMIYLSASYNQILELEGFPCVADSSGTVLAGFLSLRLPLQADLEDLLIQGISNLRTGHALMSASTKQLSTALMTAQIVRERSASIDAFPLFSEHSMIQTYHDETIVRNLLDVPVDRNCLDFDPSTGKCFLCEDGYYLYPGYNCSPCPDDCLTCDAYGCLTCDDFDCCPIHLIYDDAGQCNCIDTNCDTCDIWGCLTCKDPSKDCCPSFRVNIAGVCECKNTECETCDALGCLTCSTPGNNCCYPWWNFDGVDTCTCPDDCISCTPDGCFLCRPEELGCCSDGKYNYNGGVICLDCDSKCSTCDESGCVTCPVTSQDCCDDGRVFDGIDRCCSPECATCDEVGCLTCPTEGTDCCGGLRIFDGSTTCSCPPGCRTCDELGCLTCEAGEDDCCTLPRYLQNDGVTCDCDPLCDTCDLLGCITCASGVVDCCGVARRPDGAGSCLCPAVCDTCDEIGCVTCPVEGVDCCGPSRVLQSDEVSCGCPEGCDTCDEFGCLSCTSGVTDCCGPSRYYDSGACVFCATSDSIGCLSCPDGVTDCCPATRYLDDSDPNCQRCQDCSTECGSCDAEGCLSCTGADCCSPGRYEEGGECLECPSDCLTCDASGCLACRNVLLDAPECCPDATQNDDDKDGICECNNGKTPYSDCLCDSNEIYEYANGILGCYVTTIIPLEFLGPTQVSKICESELLEILITTYTNVALFDFAFYWSSSDPSLDLSTQRERVLRLQIADLELGTYTFHAVMEVLGVELSGSYTVEVISEGSLSVGVEGGPVFSFPSSEEQSLVAVLDSNSCQGTVTYSWVPISWDSQESPPESDEEIFVIPAYTLEHGTYVYTLTATIEGLESSYNLVLNVSFGNLEAIINSVGPIIDSEEDLILDGSDSLDHGNEPGTLDYKWTCSGDCPIFSDDTQPFLIIQGININPGMDFDITLTISKGSREGSTSLELLASPCGSGLTRKINTFLDYEVTLIANPSETIDLLTLVWSNQIYRNLNSGTSSAGLIPAESLDPGHCYVFEASFTGGTENVIIYVNKWPTCEASSGILPFEIDPHTETVMIVGCTDDDSEGQPLTYSLSINSPSDVATVELYSSFSNTAYYEFDEVGEYDVETDVCDYIGNCIKYVRTYYRGASLRDRLEVSTVFAYALSGFAVVGCAVMFMAKRKAGISRGEN